jgi:hypothetical protein
VSLLLLPMLLLLLFDAAADMFAHALVQPWGCG